MSAMNFQTVTAKPRTDMGKGAARRIRKEGHIPAIAYGKGLPSTPLAVAPKDVLAVLKSELGKNSVIQMSLADGKKLLAMIRDYSYHPVNRDLEHVDFVEVKLDQPVDVDVPLIALGKAVGVTLGGVLRQVYRTVPVRCTPERIPVKLEIDVSHLKLGEHVSTKELKLGEGVTVRLPAEQTLIAVVAPEKEKPEDIGPTGAPGAAGAAPGAAGAAPGAPGAAPGAAPAAGGAAPAAGAAAPAAAGGKGEKGKK
jgi:large subunit ribosomal protein L25